MPTCRSVPFALILATLSSFAVAQQPSPKLEQLVAKNRQLTKRNAALEAELVKLRMKLRLAQVKAEVQPKIIRFPAPGVVRPGLVAPPRLQMPVLNPGGWVVTRQAAGNALVQGEYRKALEALTRMRNELGGARDPAVARKILDRMERALLDARRALWQREQKVRDAGAGKASKSIEGGTNTTEKPTRR